jgi:L-ascorbate metabolism protein UlaG (beta-lactamase superfamily)
MEVAGIVVGLFEFVVGDNGATVGVGLQAVSRRIRAGIIRCLFMAYLKHDESATVTLQTGKTKGMNSLALTDHLKLWKLDIPLLPINGRERGVTGNFTAEEAARLGRQISTKTVIPCHYEIFEFNTVSAQLFVKAAEQIGQEYYLLKCGRRLDDEEIDSGN